VRAGDHPRSAEGDGWPPLLTDHRSTVSGDLLAGAAARNLQRAVHERDLTTGLRRSARSVGWVVKFALTIGAASVGLAAVVAGVVPRVVDILHAHEQDPVVLPPFAELAKQTDVFDASGRQIARFRLERIEEVSLDQVPADVVAAILAVEDRVYWSHKGVNLRSLVRAILSNVSAGTAGQGASTITQQVVKNEFLGGFRKDARYKFLQARYATLLEKKMSKRDILERYLNTIYFGNNAYGIAAAADTYFGKSVGELHLVEGAFLAGMIRSPSGYDPIRKPERSRNRFRFVMNRLVDEKLLGKEDAQTLADTWPIPEITKNRPGTTFASTYFTSALRDYLLEQSDILGGTPQERYNALYRGGLQIYTTLDPRLQALAEEARATQLPANAAGFDAALVSLDVKTGAIRAMVGGGGFRPGLDEINMALRPRQTGSSIKIFILAAALQAGAIPGDVIDGRRGCVLPNPANPSEPFVIDGGVAGKVGSLQEATWSSLNCAFGRLSQIVGLNRLVDTAHRMGVTSHLEPFAAFATGANELSVLDMAAGAQTIANRGLHHDPYYVERVVDASSGAVLYQRNDPGVQVLDPWVADTEVDILKGVLTKGTARRLGGLDGGARPAAGKTGTQENNTNAGFVGFTTQLATAVWVGNPRGYVPMVNVPEFLAVGVENVQGATFPASIWKAFMEPAHVGLPIEDWPAPPPASRQPARLYLPGVDCLAKPISRSSRRNTTVPAPDGSDTQGAATPQIRPNVTYVTVDPGTTVPANVIDPRWPLPAAPLGDVVYDCAAGIPKPPPPATTRPTRPRTTPPDTNASAPDPTDTTVPADSGPETTVPPAPTEPPPPATDPATTPAEPAPTAADPATSSAPPATG
jgi:penicillin-binding protein 1A